MRNPLTESVLAGLMLCAFAAALPLTAGVPQTLAHPGKKLNSSTGDLAEKTGLAGQKFLIVDCSFRLKHNPSGFNFKPVVCFSDRSGKRLQETKFSEFLPRPDHPEIVDGQLYVRIPAKAEKAALRVNFSGNPGEIELCRCDFTFAQTPEQKPPVRYQRFRSPVNLTEKELDELLAQMPPVRAEIRRCGQYNGLFLNGREVVPATYYASYYADRDNSIYNMVHAYHKIGMNFVSVCFSLGVCRPSGNGDVWRGPGQYDITPIIRNIRNILKQAPDMKILLWFDVSQYRGYAKAHPQELYVNEKGLYGSWFHSRGHAGTKKIEELPVGKDGGFSRVSDYSRAFQLEAAKAIEDVCARVAATPEGKAVAIVYLNGGRDGQWFDQWDGTGSLTDYSPAVLKAFQEFLREKYHNSEAELRKAWQQPEASFTKLRIPPRAQWWDGKKAFHTLYRENSEIHDFCEFLAWGYARRFSLWSKAAKKGCSGRWIVGSYHRAAGLRGFPQFGQLCLHRLIDDPNIDFVIKVPSYMRNCYAPVHQGGYDGSLLLHKKLLITEMDLRNGELPYYGRWGTRFWRSHNPVERFDIDVQRFAASAIEKGGAFHAYDMNGGWFNSKGSLAAWQKACGLLKERQALPWNNRHIGLFSSENFWQYQSLGKNRIAVYAAVENPAYALYRAGVPNKIYLLDELFGHRAREFKAPKVMVFLNAGSLTVQQAEQIRKEYGKDRRVIVWHWAPGMFTTDGDKNVGKITGFRLRRMKQETDLTLVAEKSSADPLLKGVSGFLYTTSEIPSVNQGISYEVTDKDAKVLARYCKNGLPGMAVKRYKDHTEVYIGSPCGLTPQLCRNLAVEAGMTPFLDTDDFCGYNAGLLYVSALTAGKKIITLPEGFVLDKVLTGQKIQAKGRKAELAMKIGELLILKLKPAQKQGEYKI